MFCKKCGQQLNDGMRFCTQCGTPTSAAQNPAAPQRPVNPQMRPQTPAQRPMNAQTGPIPRPQPAYAPAKNTGYFGKLKTKLGPAMIGYFVLVALLVLNFILISNSALLKAEAFGETVTADFEDIMEAEDGLEVIPTITTVVHIVALAILLLPLLPKIRIRGLLMFIPRLCFLWDAFWIFSVLATYAAERGVNATVGSIMIIIIALVSFIYSFVLAIQSRRYFKAMKKRMAASAMN